MNQYDLLESLRRAVSYVETRSGISVRRQVDVETARITALCRLQGADRPHLPRVAPSYAESGRVNSIADLEDLLGQLTSNLDAARETPEAYGIVWVTRDDTVEEGAQ